jgi:acyl-CoA thioester hydrolase
MLEHRLTIPERTPTSRVDYRVPFYDTDAMGVVHHANYVRYLELARVRFLKDHDEPYQNYVALGYHVVVTRVDIRLRKPSRFDDALAVTCWLERVRNASLTFGYQIQCDAELVSTALTEHGIVNMKGKVVRMPLDRKARLLALVTPQVVAGAAVHD